MKFLAFWLSVLIFQISSGSVWGAGSPDAPFYAGKTIKIMRGGGPGGFGDMQTRAVMPYLRKYIPGEPTILLEYVPGAAGLKMANQLYRIAQPDGLTIGALGAGLVAGTVLGLTGVDYQLDRFSYLGSTTTGEPYIFYTRKDAGIDTLRKLRDTTGLRIGAETVGHPKYYGGRLVAYLLDLKTVRFVTGYDGPDLDAAVLAGEVDGLLNSANTVLHRNPDWFEKGLVHVHLGVSLPKGSPHPKFSNLPDIDTFAKSQKDHALLTLFRALQLPRWPYFFPPNTSSEHVQILRTAFRRTFSDPSFSKDFKKMTGTDPSPLHGEELERLIKEVPRDPETISLFRQFAGPDPLPSR
jgi:tripartite-type tricarboxylate transporter receptor subunit TctC